jgi:NAD+ kinase
VPDQPIAFLINPDKLVGWPAAPGLVADAVSRLQALGRNVVVNERASMHLRDAYRAVPDEALGQGARLIVGLGGDGTILQAARIAQGRIPVLGVRAGGFGFLAELNVEDLPAAAGRIAANDYEVEERMMLEAAVEEAGKVTERFTGLNDVVVTGAGVARVLRLSAFVNDEPLATYPADGLIVSTPTGSTAYSLSAGGPIVHPSVEVIILTPIAPHTFNARSVIVGRDDRITIEFSETTERESLGKVQGYPGGHAGARPLERSREAWLTVDGQVGCRLEPHQRVLTQRAEVTTKLVRLSRWSFYGILRAKLAWGGR